MINAATANLRAKPESKVVMEKKQLLRFRTDNVVEGEFRILIKGQWYDIKHKDVGLGQYQVWLEKSDYKLFPKPA